MMEFCVRHAIKPQVEHLPFDQVNQAIERLHRGDVRYRFVPDQTAYWMAESALGCLVGLAESIILLSLVERVSQLA